VLDVPSVPSGRSPRARGNPSCPSSPPPQEGPIPAGAGKPRFTAWSSRPEGADPRGRGETAVGPVDDGLGTGRSPRARGNQVGEGRDGHRLRPIPAGAGKPSTAPHGNSRSRADPRGRGETAPTAQAPHCSAGRSPRARGNLVVGRHPKARLGPIPAGAGKPYRGPPRPTPLRADPRGRGETAALPSVTSRTAGRSPRARGNRATRLPRDDRHGPILAGAGKPPGMEATPPLATADPRGRGETCARGLPLREGDGRSPRARGNPRIAHDAPEVLGPIPAGAGKPPLRRRSGGRRTADPRGRGEPG